MRDADRPARRRAARHGAAASAARARRALAPLAATVAVLSLGLTFTLAPQPRAITAPAATGAHAEAAQTVSVAPDAAVPPVSHDSYAATTGAETLVASGTNADWAKLVLLFGDWPVTDENVTVVLQWMREENGPDNWWTRTIYSHQVQPTLDVPVIGWDLRASRGGRWMTGTIATDARCASFRDCTRPRIHGGARGT